MMAAKSTMRTAFLLSTCVFFVHGFYPTAPRLKIHSTHLFSTAERPKPRRQAPSNRKLINIQQIIKAKEIEERMQNQKPILQTWRVFGLAVHPDDDIIGDLTVDADRDVQLQYMSPPLLEALQKRLKLKSDQLINPRVVRRSVDARKRLRTPNFMYVVDVDVDTRLSGKSKFKEQPGKLERVIGEDKSIVGESGDNDNDDSSKPKKKVLIVGAGPAGLFCALQLAQHGGVEPIIVERGQPVEKRGRDIGALIHRLKLDSNSNFAFGEGGAGTWSDGKLTTRIGRNSGQVRKVLETFVQYGAPPKILVDGAPHLGTDNLVRLLRNMRKDLEDSYGATIQFGCQMTDLDVVEGTSGDTNKHIQGIRVESVANGDVEASGPTTLEGDAVVLATGHSARDVYERLHSAGINLEAKGFAVGFRIEHPQSIINKIQYGNSWGSTVKTGKKTTDTVNHDYFEQQKAESTGNEATEHKGKLPVPSYRLATDKASDGESTRGVYSFCMCPGGQIVPSSTDPDEVCVNGMSFSKRDSVWANSALVVTVAADDVVLEEYREKHGILAGLEFQRDMERRASKLGGGNLTVPVQRMTDFVKGRVSSTVPSSSYRLGVRSAPCHELYPAQLTASIRDALTTKFDSQMPGYFCEEGLLHGVETRTSSPLRISRDSETCLAVGSDNLFPAGEGAGFAGGIVSAAVDGMTVADAILENLFPNESGSSKLSKKEKSVGFSY